MRARMMINEFLKIGLYKKEVGYNMKYKSN
jgi:hypothetical protein